MHQTRVMQLWRRAALLFAASEAGAPRIAYVLGGEPLTLAAPVVYRTTLAYLDAKEWGVPQTRARKYMLLWKEGSFGEGVDVARRWHELCTHLRCPLKYNVDSFLLADENDAPPSPPHLRLHRRPSPPPWDSAAPSAAALRVSYRHRRPAFLSCRPAPRAAPSRR